MIAAALLDYAVRTTDRGLRIMLSFGLAVALLSIAYRLTYRWLRQRWTESAAAQAIQQAFPELGDRLASALEFLRQDEHDPTAGSVPLRRAVIAEATARLEELPAEQVAERRSVPRAISAALLAALVAIAFALLAPDATHTALVRLAAPWNDAEWPRRNDLEFVKPPELLARGDSFEVSLVDAGGSLPSEVAIEYRYDVDGRPRTEVSWMQRVGSTMVARRENVRRSFEYRASGGDHRTMRWRQLQVVDRPTVANVELTVHPPAYTGLSSVTTSGDVRLLAGSQVRLTAAASQPLDRALLTASPNEPVVVEVDGTSLVLAAEQWTVASNTANHTLRPQIELVAQNGLKGVASLPTLEVVADAVPEVDWASPAADLSVVANAQIPVAVVARDDLALQSVGFRMAAVVPDSDLELPAPVEFYRGDDTAPPRDDIPRYDEMLDRQEFVHQLDLAPLDLPMGTVLELSASAQDYKPQIGTTQRSRRLTIISAADLDSQLAQSQADILRLLEQALADERTAREQASRAAREASGSSPIDRASIDALVATRLTQQGVRRTLVGEQTGVVALTQDVLERIAMNRMQHPELVAQLEQIHDTVVALEQGTLPAAEQRLTDLRKSFEAELGRRATDDNLDSFVALDGEQLRVIETLEQLIDKANAWSDADRFGRELARLEQEQRELRREAIEKARQTLLAQTDRNTPPVDKAELDRLAAAQADLARRFEKLAQSMRQMASTAATPPNLAARLGDAAAAAETMQLSAQLVDAARAIDQQQLGRAADTQQSAADGLRELIERLRDRAPADPGELASRLRELKRQLGDLEQRAREAEQEANQPQQDAQRRDLQQQLSRMARELARLTAAAASQSTERASKMHNPKQVNRLSNPKRACSKRNATSSRLSANCNSVLQNLKVKANNGCSTDWPRCSMG